MLARREDHGRDPRPEEGDRALLLARAAEHLAAFAPNGDERVSLRRRAAAAGAEEAAALGQIVGNWWRHGSGCGPCTTRRRAEPIGSSAWPSAFCHRCCAVEVGWRLAPAGGDTGSRRGGRASVAAAWRPGGGAAAAIITPTTSAPCEWPPRSGAAGETAACRLQARCGLEIDRRHASTMAGRTLSSGRRRRQEIPTGTRSARWGARRAAMARQSRRVRDYALGAPSSGDSLSDGRRAWRGSGRMHTALWALVALDPAADSPAHLSAARDDDVREIEGCGVVDRSSPDLFAADGRRLLEPQQRCRPGLRATSIGRRGQRRAGLLRPRGLGADGPRVRDGASGGLVEPGASGKAPRPLTRARIPGTKGVDAGGSWMSRVEFGGLVKHLAKPYVRTLTSTPSLSSSN